MDVRNQDSLTIKLLKIATLLVAYFLSSCGPGVDISSTTTTCDSKSTSLTPQSFQLNAGGANVPTGGSCVAQTFTPLMSGFVHGLDLTPGTAGSFNIKVIQGAPITALAQTAPFDCLTQVAASATGSAGISIHVEIPTNQRPFVKAGQTYTFLLGNGSSNWNTYGYTAGGSGYGYAPTSAGAWAIPSGNGINMTFTIDPRPPCAK